MQEEVALGTGGEEFKSWLPLSLPVSSEHVLVSLYVKLISLNHALNVDTWAGSHGTRVTSNQATPTHCQAHYLLLVPTPLSSGSLRALELG